MGNAESQPVRNVDKRTARRHHQPAFALAIEHFRAHAGAAADRVAAAAASGGGEPESRLRVCVRRRPIFAHELKAGEFDVLSCDEGSIVVHDCRLRPDCRTLFVNHTSFSFDRVFDEHTNSGTVYACEVAPLVRLICRASVPACVMMYGQTGSGKTFTMRALFDAAAHDIFASLSPGDEVTASYAELGGGGARDLLAGGAGCNPLTDHAGDVQLVPSVEVPVRDAAGLRALFAYGTAIRATAATGVHDASSRSHALFRVFVQRSGAPAGAAGVLTLVDLAGSEQRIDSEKHDRKRTKVRRCHPLRRRRRVCALSPHPFHPTSSCTKESAMINASLFALKDCVRP